MRSMPDFVRYSEWSFYPEGHTRGFVSERGDGDVQGGPGARICATVTLPALSLSEGRQVRAWLNSLRGKAQETTARVPSAFAPAPTSSEALTADDGTTVLTADDGTTVLMTDEPSNADVTIDFLGTGLLGSNTVTADALPSYITAGMWLQIGTTPSQLVIITSIAGSVLTVTPKLRLGFTKMQCFFGVVKGRFRLSKDVPVVPFLPTRTAPFSIDFEEAI